MVQYNIVNYNAFPPSSIIVIVLMMVMMMMIKVIMVPLCSEKKNVFHLASVHRCLLVLTVLDFVCLSEHPCLMLSPLPAPRYDRLPTQSVGHRTNGWSCDFCRGESRYKLVKLQRT